MAAKLLSTNKTKYLPSIEGTTMSEKKEKEESTEKRVQSIKIPP